MKKVYLILLLALCSCLGYKELPVEYDYSYRGNFKKYRTFDFIKPKVLYDSSESRDAVEKSIATRMKFLGYKRTTSRPHLLISYKIFDDSLRFQGYQQENFEHWLKDRRSDLNYDKKKINMRTGTLLILFYDRRQNQSVWQGYATMEYGLIDYNNQRQLRNAVISILDKYRVWADGFLEQQAQIQEVSNP